MTTEDNIQQAPDPVESPERVALKAHARDALAAHMVARDYSIEIDNIDGGALAAEDAALELAGVVVDRLFEVGIAVPVGLSSEAVV